MNKTLIAAIIIGIILWFEYYLIGGLNGLTILALPLTMFLGLNALEKLDEYWKQKEQNEQNKKENN